MDKKARAKTGVTKTQEKWVGFAEIHSFTSLLTTDGYWPSRKNTKKKGGTNANNVKKKLAK